MGRNPKPTVNLSKAVPLLPDGIVNRRRPPTQRSSPQTSSNPAPPQSLHGASQPLGGYGEADFTDEMPAPPHALPHARARHMPGKAQRIYRRRKNLTPSESEAHQRATRTRSEFRPSSSNREASGAP